MSASRFADPVNPVTNPVNPVYAELILHANLMFQDEERAALAGDFLDEVVRCASFGKISCW